MKKYTLPFSLSIVLLLFFMVDHFFFKQKKKPNVLIFYTDDNDFSYWGFGGGIPLSPNIDELAANGLVARSFYANSSVCTPSRYTMHTGKYAGRCQASTFKTAFPTDQPYNITWNTPVEKNTGDKSMGKYFQEAGYKTGLVGKWHLGFDKENDGLKADDSPFDPQVAQKLKQFQKKAQESITSLGFDYAASIVPENNDEHPLEALRVHNLEWTAKGARNFLDQYASADDPFMLMVNITTHHGPCQVASLQADPRFTSAGVVDGLEGFMPSRAEIEARIKAKNLPLDFKTVGTAWTDALVASVMQKLEESGQAENTIVIFTTDHNRFDGKGTLYQGGVHIPFIINYPKQIAEGGVSEQAFSMVDILPTLLEAIDAPKATHIDGKSVWKQLTGQASEEERSIYLEMGYARGLLKGNKKFISFRYPDALLNKMKNKEVSEAIHYKGHTQDTPEITRYPHYFDHEQFYLVDQDKEEQHNLISVEAHQTDIQEMKTELGTILTSFAHPYPLDTPIDAFLLSKEFEQLKAASRKQNMDQYYWYRQACY